MKAPVAQPTVGTLRNLPELNMKILEGAEARAELLVQGPSNSVRREIASAINSLGDKWRIYRNDPNIVTAGRIPNWLWWFQRIMGTKHNLIKANLSDAGGGATRVNLLVHIYNASFLRMIGDSKEDLGQKGAEIIQTLTLTIVRTGLRVSSNLEASSLPTAHSP